MAKYTAEMRKEEERLMNEIESMKFSFKKLLKCIELEAILSYQNA